MKMDTDNCFCVYHSLQQQTHLSKKMEELGVSGSTHQVDNFEKQSKLPSNNGGVKRNFESIHDEGDSAKTAQPSHHMVHERKRVKSSCIEEMMTCKESVDMEGETIKTATNVKTQSMVCYRCLNGEPGHINHLSQTVEAMEE